MLTTKLNYNYFFIASLLLLLPLITTSQDLEYQWAYNPGGKHISGYGPQEMGEGVAIDRNGNVYLNGHTEDTADFDPSPDSALLPQTDFFLSKYDQQGNYQWAFSLNADVESDMATDKANNVYVWGRLNDDTVDLDPSADTANMVADNGNDFIAKYDASGNFLWAINIGLALSSQHSLDIEYDNNGYLYISGSTGNSKVDFDPGQDSAVIDGNHTFLAKYDVDGNLQWVKDMNTGIDNMTVDGSNIYISGTHADTTDFDLSSDTARLIAESGESIYIAKYTSQGNYVWAKQLDGTSDENEAWDIELNNHSNNIFLCGEVRDTIDFDPSADSVIVTTPLNDRGYREEAMFLAKYDTSGNYQWMHHSLELSVRQMEVNEQNEVYLSGNFSDGTDFDFSSDSAYIDASGGRYLAKYSSMGDYISAFKITSYVVLSMKYRDGAVAVSGFFNEETEFGPSPTTTIVSNGYYDPFVARYSDNTVTGSGLQSQTGGKDGYTLFPNPSNGVVNLACPASAAKTLTLSLVNQNGKRLKEKTFSTEQGAVKQLNIQGLSPGIYFVKILDQATGIVRVKKLIVR